MSDRCRARVIRVKRDKHGAVLASVAAIGDTVLLVKDAGDLAVDDEVAGTLLVDDDAGTQVTYSDVEYVEDTDQGDLTSPDTVTLSAPLAVTIDADTQLWVYEDPEDPDDDDGIVSDWIAICVPEDDEDTANLGGRLEADIPPDYRDDLPVGEQPAPGVPVVLEYDDETDDWTVLRLRGARRGMRYNRHHLTAGAAPDGGTVGDAVTADEISAGSLTRQLPHRRIVRSQAFRVLVNGVEYGPGAWELDPVNGVVTLTLGGWETPDNADIWFEYWHRGLTVVAPDPDPVTPTWIVPQAITDYYDADAVYHSTGPLTGQTFVEAQPTGSWGNHGRYNFSWTLPAEFGTFAELGIVGIKFVGEFDGDGEVFFAINANDPGWPGTPEWTDDSGYSHLTLNPTDSFVVSGPTTHEWILALTDTASDDLYQGLSYNNPLQDFEISLHASVAEGYDANYCDGTLQGASAGTVDLLRFDMVLIGTPS